MKKLLFPLLALGTAGMAGATDYTLTPDYSSATYYAGGGTLSGFSDTLDGIGMAVTGGDAYSSAETLYLTSISVNVISGSNVKLAVYEASGVTFSSLVGLSETASAADGVLKFDFSAAPELSPSQNYAFIYVVGTTTLQDLEGSDLSTALLAVDSSVTQSFYTNVSGTTSSSAYTPRNNTLQNQDNWHVGGLSYSVSDVNPAQSLPEPSAAVFSLVALAGLASRRRRM